MTHTKEPWFEVETECDVIEITNDERNGLVVPIAKVSTGFNGQVGIEQEANARRIVACVNACEGIPTGVLEKQGMVPIEQVTHDIEQQRDKLLAALESLLLITADSKGVAGYHLNGAVANWDEFPEVNEAALLVTQLKGQS